MNSSWRVGSAMVGSLAGRGSVAGGGDGAALRVAAVRCGGRDAALATAATRKCGARLANLFRGKTYCFFFVKKELKGD